MSYDVSRKSSHPGAKRRKGAVGNVEAAESGISEENSRIEI
jgi:hypothetical protein